MKKILRGLLAMSVFLTLSTSYAGVQTLFFDNFEFGLSQWVGKGGGSHHGIIVEDPLQSGNYVLTFTALNLSGDIFGSDVEVERGKRYILSFDYLGLPGAGEPGNLGGYIGFAEDTPGRHRWLEGTFFCCDAESGELIDDGQWHSYSIEFDVFADGLPGQAYTFAFIPPSNNTIKVMVEDFIKWGVAGDVFFDNIRLSEVECVPPPSDMVSWWPGDGDANDIADGNDGMLNGATYLPGKVDQAFSFDGVDDYVSLGTTQIIGDDTSFTIDAWIKVNRFAADNKQLPIYGEFNTGTDDTKNYLAVGNLQPGLEQRVFFDQYIPRTDYLKSTIQLTPGRWYHVAYAQDGTTRWLYIDGMLDNSDSTIETYAGQMPDDIRIGMRGGSTASTLRFDGLIDELEIFNRALSADEIQAIYNAGSAGKCKELAIEVETDIKPGSDPNSINLGEYGLLPVAILGTQNFDVTTIDPYSIEIGGVSLALRGPAKKVQKLAYSYEDVDEDGNIDMMVFFDVQELVDEGILTGTTTELLITATLNDETQIEGTDSVNIVH